MKKSLLIVVLLALSVLTFGQSIVKTIPDSNQTTLCNPLNLSYRFCLDDPSRREAADPVIVLYKGEYWLFASKTGGYWHSADLISWNFIACTDLPVEDYAPAAVVINDILYFMASAPAPVKIYKTQDPKSAKWQVATSTFPIGMIDPDLFLDDDGRLYFYYGCSNEKPIYAVELDTKSFQPKGTPVVCFNSNKEINGWEQKGDYNNQPERPWIEGAWMTKHEGKYYLQYAGPGTEYKSYSDGLYVSDQPLGPFKLAEHNPISLKPEGFIAGAGHSCTFQDKYGNYWHIVTMAISQKHMFERRLGLFPMFFDKEGVLYTSTGFGDFPFTVPRKKISSPDELFPNWMLLSYNKPLEVSSEMSDHPRRLAADEEIRTYWSAQTGDKGEWIGMDLEKECTLHAVQLNFAENQTTLHGRNPNNYYQYLLEYSIDKKTWKVLADKTQNKTDVPHDYLQLSVPIKARYIRLTNYRVPDGTFALSGLRIFGNGQGSNPGKVLKFTAERTQNDRREVNLQWDPPKSAVGYNIRYGIHPAKLYHTYQVLGQNSLTIRSLNSTQKYFFTIDAFNENGTLKGAKILEVE
ncbi:MAG: family 43 glycosylhydrolase [Prolixibacteraceae bacterium]